MSNVPKFSSYSSDQLQQAAQDCPAIMQYLQILKSEAQNFDQEIRLERHEAWLSSALAVYHQTASPKDVCSYWSEHSAKLIRDCWVSHGLDKEPLALFALGKLGAEELNLSSDVDLIITGTSPDPKQALLKVRAFKKSLESRSEFAYALRVDFDLRPDGSWGPLLISVPMFQDHYWSRGEAWERLALVRLRFLIGDQDIRNEIEELANRFTYRKFIDYSLQQELKSLRSRIHNLSSPAKPDSINLKLGVGGIRDIELFVHSLQVMHGGRNAQLQTHNTDLAFERLSKVLPHYKPSLDKLQQCYWELRHLENEVQIYSDEQTHSLSRKPQYPRTNPERWSETIELMAGVDQLVSVLLGEIDSTTSHLPQKENEQIAWLKKFNFPENSIRDIWPEILAATPKSGAKKDEVLRQELIFQFIEELGKRKSGKDVALLYFRDLIKSTRTKVSLHLLLVRETQLLKLLAKLFSSSRSMAQIVTSRPELLESFLQKTDCSKLDVPEALQDLMDRRFVAEIRSALLFQSRQDPDRASLDLSQTADQICQEIQSLVERDVQSHFHIVALGKWGTYEMGFHSDLDFLLLKKGAVTPDDHKAAKRFINYLTSRQKGGKIYSVDLRLRPSGAAGPLMVSLENFEQYLKSDAKAWERQSYLKIRPLDGDLDLPLDEIFRKGLDAQEKKDLKDIRGRLLRPRSPLGMDIKYSPGGLVDIELCVQAAILDAKIKALGSTRQLASALMQVQEPWKVNAESLIENYRFLRKVEQSYRLVAQGSGLDLKPGKGDFHATAHLLNTSPEQLWQLLQDTLEHSQALIKDLDPVYRDE